MEPHNTSVSPPPSPSAYAYVLHAREHLDDCFLYRLPMPQAKLITGMADWADCYGLVSSLWIDARITWRLLGFSMFGALQPQRDMQICIYNSEYLAPELSNFHHPQLSFVRGGIHPSMFEPTFALAA